MQGRMERFALLGVGIAPPQTQEQTLGLELEVPTGRMNPSKGGCLGMFDQVRAAVWEAGK